MQTRIQGTTMPVLEVQLDPNESVYSESGELSWMTASIQMTTHTQMGGGGGLFGILKRVAGVGSLFMTEYRAAGYPGEVSFATKVPGHIVPVQLGQGLADGFEAGRGRTQWILVGRQFEDALDRQPQFAGDFLNRPAGLIDGQGF